MRAKHFLTLIFLISFLLPADAQRVHNVQPDTIPARAEMDDNEDGGYNIDFTLADSLRTDTMTWEQTLVQKLDKMMEHSLLGTSQLGLMVWDLDADSCLYRHGERQRLRPASTMKILTAVTALDYLGSSYRFSTELRSKDVITDNLDSTRTYRGQLYCVGGMDPCFGKADMNTFVSAIRDLGVDSIIGSIYGDESFKDDKLLGEGWCWDDDNPTLSPLLVDRKNRFTSMLYDRIREGRAVVWAGTGHATVPSDTRLLCRVEHTMDDVLRPMLKNSDNLYAEAMFYQIANRRKGKNAKAADARAQIYDTMRKAGLSTSPYYVADGSGLSLYTYVTAQAETMLLRYAYGKPDIYGPLSRALPVAGVDGTLASRMKGSATKGNVRAKTGTVTGVSSLAGYCKGGNGHQLCFSIINQGVNTSSEGRSFQDAICTILCK